MFLKVLVILSFYLHANCLTSTSGKVLVLGATGRVGRLVVQEILNRPNSTLSVRAFVRDKSKAVAVFGPEYLENNRLEIVKGDISNSQQLKEYSQDCDASIWCATGFSDSESASAVNKIIGALKLKFFPQRTIDIESLQQLGSLMADRPGVVPGGPTVVLCSSAGVTRPTWDADKKRRLVGAADIPIVRLNPLDILGLKRAGEQALRLTRARYAVVRPCGLNDKAPAGRPIFSQGDVAVGRVSRVDAAQTLVDVLLTPESVGKTFEVFAVPGLSRPRSIRDQCARLLPDGAPLSEDAVATTYDLLQQLVPGQILRPNELAMGQSYEQLDAGVSGRLGARGSEVAPIVADS